MANGIVRRLDELGRIVIPKEIRRSMRLHVGDEVDIIYDGEGVRLTKYSSLEGIHNISRNVARQLSRALECNVIFVGTSRVIVAEGKDKKEYVGASLADKFIRIVRAREEAILHGEDLHDVFLGKPCKCAYLVFEPLIVGGDLIGGGALLLDSLPSDIARAYLHFCVGLVESVLNG